MQVDHWSAIGRIVQAVADKYGFKSNMDPSRSEPLRLEDGWLVLASYRNQKMHLGRTAGGGAEVVFIVFGREESAEIDIALIDYSNATESDFVREIRSVVDREIRALELSIEITVTSHVVGALPP